MVNSQAHLCLSDAQETGGCSDVHALHSPIRGWLRLLSWKDGNEVELVQQTAMAMVEERLWSGDGELRVASCGGWRDGAAHRQQPSERAAARRRPTREQPRQLNHDELTFFACFASRAPRVVCAAGCLTAWVHFFFACFFFLFLCDEDDDV